MREDFRFMLWCGEKFLAGDPLTEQERVDFKECHDRQKVRALNMMRIKPEQYQYEAGQDYE